MKGIFCCIALLILVLSFAGISDARWYDPQTGKFMTRDPLGEYADVNLYRYTRNSPINWVDPFGLDIAVIYGLPQGNNVFGHIAVGVSGYGVYSYGTPEPFGSSTSQYLRNQAKYRDSIVWVLPTSKEQDAAFVAAFLKANASGPNTAMNNCADMVGAGLKAAGLLKDRAALTFPGLINNYMLMRAYEGRVSTLINIYQGNQQWGVIDNVMRLFNPGGTAK